MAGVFGEMSYVDATLKIGLRHVTH
jgi:hypothetical protein